MGIMYRVTGKKISAHTFANMDNPDQGGSCRVLAFCQSVLQYLGFLQGNECLLDYIYIYANIH